MTTVSLFRSLPNDVDALPTRGANSQRELVSCDRNDALLICAVPIREGTTFNMNCNAAIHLIDRVCSEVGYGPISGCLVFFRCTLPEGIACVSGTVRPHDRDNESPISIKKGDARWICTVLL